MEKWKVIEEYPKYSVSNFGNIKNNKTGRILKPAKDSNGYPFVCLFDNKGHTKTIHRMVAKAFIPNPENLRDINHINGNKTDNRVENLEWCAHSKNVAHAIEELGSNTGHGKRRSIKCIETGVVYPTVKSAAKFAGVSDMAIRKCLYGQMHTSAGYHWEYAI